MKESTVQLISITPEAEKTIAYCARVSNPENQENSNIQSLIKYCAKHGHWSIFEQANLVLEIQTSRAISPQILRHRSFSFQEFSQRYSVVPGFVRTRARRQDNKNKQNSYDDLSGETQQWFSRAQDEVWSLAESKYREALNQGIAKECARSLLPLSAQTKLYMNGTVRSWIHYIQTRTHPSTQAEHREIAEQCKAIFVQQLPLVSEAMGWREGSIPAI